MMPTSIAKAKPRSTSPPNRYSASTARNVVPAVMIVRPSVWLTLRFTTFSSGSRRSSRAVLAHAVEDDDGVVHRVAGDRQDRGDDVQRQLVAEEGQEREDDEDVVERRDDRADREDEPEAQRDVDVMPRIEASVA